MVDASDGYQVVDIVTPRSELLVSEVYFTISRMQLHSTHHDLGILDMSGLTSQWHDLSKTRLLTSLVSTKVLPSFLMAFTSSRSMRPGWVGLIMDTMVSIFYQGCWCHLLVMMTSSNTPSPQGQVGADGVNHGMGGHDIGQLDFIKLEDGKCRRG